jgi:hypothetical protein
MAATASLRSNFYRIPLPVALTDSTHGAHDITVHLLAAAPNRSYLEAHGRDRRCVVADNTVFHERGRESKILVPIIPLEPSHP